MKKILIVPRHTGVNTMPWAWMLSRSTDFYSVTLPPPQFMPVSAGAAGYYPEITQDFFYAHFRANVDDLKLGESIRVLQDFQECIWDNDKQIEDAFANFISNYKDINSLGAYFGSKLKAKSRLLVETRIINLLTTDNSKTAEMKHIDNLTYNTFIKNSYFILKVAF